MFCNFWDKEISANAACKMLVKLTKGVDGENAFFLWLNQQTISHFVSAGSAIICPFSSYFDRKRGHVWLVFLDLFFIRGTLCKFCTYLKALTRWLSRSEYQISVIIEIGTQLAAPRMGTPVLDIKRQTVSIEIELH